MESLAQLITRRRRELGLHLKDLSKQVKKSDGSSISVQYMDDMEKGRRIPTPELLPQLAEALELPADLLYFVLGLLPPDIQSLATTPEQVLSAVQAFRRALESLGEAMGSTDTTPVRYERVASLASPLVVVREARSGLLERREGQGF
jgi:transcriptional regulator with XRE-family HTH domain